MLSGKQIIIGVSGGIAAYKAVAVSYTHLDVYKRQGDTCSFVLTQFRRKDFSGRGTGQMERGVPAGMNPTFLKGITQYRKISCRYPL